MSSDVCIALPLYNIPLFSGQPIDCAFNNQPWPLLKANVTTPAYKDYWTIYILLGRFLGLRVSLFVYLVKFLSVLERALK